LPRHNQKTTQIKFSLFALQQRIRSQPATFFVCESNPPILNHAALISQPKADFQQSAQNIRNRS
jgi:hypothetical protein